MKKCPFCDEKIQDSAKKCRHCGERINKKNNGIKKNTGIGWRITKILYFIITIPLVLGIILLSKSDIYRGLITVTDYYGWIMRLIITLISYLVITDFLKKIASYVIDESFKGFLDYKTLFTEKLKYILSLIFIIAILSFGSIKLNNECTGPNQTFNDFGVCSCTDGYFKSGDICVVSVEKEIANKLENLGKLRELKSVPNNPNIYLGLYVKNEKINDNEGLPYDTCPGQVEGQSIDGEYHLFTYEDGKITSDIKIPGGYDNSNIKLSLSYKNTKINNYNFFGGEKPIDEADNIMLEKTNLIIFNDYNGDGFKYEFLLISYIDGMCGHNSYLIGGFDPTTKHAAIYGIKDKDGTKYRGDNFIPNEKGEVYNGISCGDHGSEIEIKNQYKFNKKQSIYILTNTKEKQCNADGTTSPIILNGTQTILQDVNLRDSASAAGNIIQKLDQSNVVSILSNTISDGVVRYYVDFHGTQGWISSIAFIYKI